jgi:ribosome-associated heat shock protein Hsp15
MAALAMRCSRFVSSQVRVAFATLQAVRGFGPSRLRVHAARAALQVVQGGARTRSRPEAGEPANPRTGRRTYTILVADSVRLDIWLDVACLFKTRSEAQRACKIGRVILNGVVAKPHRDVRISDEIVINRPGGRRQTVRVQGVADRHIAKADARALYEDLTPPPSAEEIESRRLERVFKAATSPPTRLPRRHQRDVAKRKWTT